MKEDGRRVNTIFRITALVLVQAFMFLECGWAGGAIIIPKPQSDYPTTLSPRISIDINQFQTVFYQQASAVKNNSDFKPPLKSVQAEINQRQERDKQFILKILQEWMNSEQLKNLGSALFAFGSARFREDNPFFQSAFSFARRAAWANFAIITGGGPGIMLAANKGAFGFATSIGLNIKLPEEQKGNPNQNISLLFNYFFLRKLVFILFSRGGAVFPGGFGTLEEVFEVLAFNLRHPDAVRPIVLVNVDFYGGLMEVLSDWHKAGIMSKLDDKVFTLRHTEKEAFEYLAHLWTEYPARQEMDIYSFINALFRASRRLYRVEPTVTILGGDRIEPESDLGRMAFELATDFTDRGISVMRRGHEGIAASVAGAYDTQMETSKPGRGLFISLGEGVADARSLKADRAFHFRYNNALKVAMLKHSTLGFVFFPGGIDTLDMLFEVICLIQTGKIEPVPIVLVGEKWQELYAWIEKVMIPHKTIKKKDLALVKMARTKEEAEQIILEAHRDIKANQNIPYWKNLDTILHMIDKELGLKQDEIGNLYAVCDVWAEKAQERLGVLDFVEFAEVLQIGFHWLLIVKFKNNEQLYAFDRTIGQFLTQGEGLLKQQIAMMNNFVELDEIKDFVEVNQNGFYGKAIEHPLARYIFSEEYMQRDDDLSYLAPLLKRYQFYTQHNLGAASEKEKIITAMTRILQYNNISLLKDRELSFYFVSNDTGQTLTFDAFKNPRQFKSKGKVYVFGQDAIPAALNKAIENMKESFKQTVLPQQGVVLSMRKEELYAFEKLTDFPEELMNYVFASSEEIIRNISPHLKQVIAILETYKSRQIIKSYYIFGSFLKGILRNTTDADIDLAIDFAYYHDPDVVRGLLERVNAISKQAGHRFHITLQAFGYEYEIRDGSIVPTGKVIAENVLKGIENPHEKSLLRLDNLEISASGEEFFVNILSMCREFDFTQNNLKSIPLKQKLARIKDAYSRITSRQAYPMATITSDKTGKPVGLFVSSPIDGVNNILTILPINAKTKVAVLGSGTGQVCSLFAAHGATQVTGYEIDEKLKDLSEEKIQELKDVIDPDKIEFKNANFLDKDVSLKEYDILFYFWDGLLREHMSKFQEKIMRQLAPGALFVAYNLLYAQEYFPQLKEASYLDGYEEINLETKILTQINYGKLFTAEHINQNQTGKDEIPMNKLVSILKKMGFRYADQFNPDFKLPFYTENGKLQTLMVSADGEYVFTLRERIDFSYGEEKEERSIQLLELNPFVNDNEKFEMRTGFNKFIIDQKNRVAHAGISNTYEFFVEDMYRGKGLGLAMLSLAIQAAQQEGMHSFKIYNPVTKIRPVLKSIGFYDVDSSTVELNLEATWKTETDGSEPWRLANIAKRRKDMAGFRFVNLPGFDLEKSKNKHAMYEEDLESQDPAVRLKAAIALRERGIINEKITTIFEDAAIGENFTLAERIKAAQYVSNAYKKKERHILGRYQAHFDRIDRANEEEFKYLAPEFISQYEMERIIEEIPRLDAEAVRQIIERIKRIKWKGSELERMLQGIKYFSGAWEVELREELHLEYDIHWGQLDQLIKKDVPTEIIFSPAEYLFAAVIAQELISELRDKKEIIMGGDHDWFLLESFQMVRAKKYASFLNGGDEIKTELKNRWFVSTAASRTIDIFNGLDKLGLFINRFESDVELVAVLSSANQFIYNAYDDGSFPEFSPGPCYDARGMSVGIECARDKEKDSIHVNLGTRWASKYVWAAYLVMHNYINDKTFYAWNGNYYYSQLVKDEHRIDDLDRRASYIGVWVKEIKDLKKIMDIFIPLSIALRDYMEGDDENLAKIWRDFRIKMEQIIRSQNDEKLDEEFFERARMVRFVERVSANNRDNDFYRDLSNLIKDTLVKIREHLAMKEQEKRVITMLETKLKPIAEGRNPAIHNEVKIETDGFVNLKAAVSGSHVLLKNTATAEMLWITLIAKKIPASGRQAPSIERDESFIYIGNDVYEVVEDGIIDIKTKKKTEFKREANGQLVINLSELEENDVVRKLFMLSEHTFENIPLSRQLIVPFAPKLFEQAI
ncbi:MAG: LOG family protein [Candidatus Omnitrophota bacterium]